MSSACEAYADVPACVHGRGSVPACALCRQTWRHAVSRRPLVCVGCSAWRPTSPFPSHLRHPAPQVKQGVESGEADSGFGVPEDVRARARG